MNLPTWVTIVGVFMILLGGCGACSNLSKVKRPKDLENSAEIFDQVKKEFEESTGESNSNSTPDTLLNDGEYTFDSLMINTEGMDSASLKKFEEIVDGFGGMLVFSDYYKKWIVRLGIIGMVVSLIYLLSGFLLVLGKPIALKLSYTAIGLSCSFLIFQLIVMSMDKEGGAFSKMSTSIGSYVMLLINVVLIIVIVSSDKSFFYQHEIIKE